MQKASGKKCTRFCCFGREALYKRAKVVYNYTNVGVKNAKGIFMKYRESEEMYLETILLLSKQKTDIHSIDIAAELNFSKPSVSRAVGLLEKNGYITRSESGEIRFTESGLKKATHIYERHRIITALLEVVGADKELAEENACRIEHVISEEMFEIMKSFVESHKN